MNDPISLSQKRGLRNFFMLCKYEKITNKGTPEYNEMESRVNDILTMLEGITTIIGEDSAKQLYEGFFPSSDYYIIPDLNKIYNGYTILYIMTENTIREKLYGTLSFLSNCIKNNTIEFFRNIPNGDSKNGNKMTRRIALAFTLKLPDIDLIDTTRLKLLTKDQTQGFAMNLNEPDFNIRSFLGVEDTPPFESTPVNIKEAIRYKLYKLQKFPVHLFQSMCFEYFLNTFEFNFTDGDGDDNKSTTSMAKKLLRDVYLNTDVQALKDLQEETALLNEIDQQNASELEKIDEEFKKAHNDYEKALESGNEEEIMKGEMLIDKYDNLKKETEAFQEQKRKDLEIELKTKASKEKKAIIQNHTKAIQAVKENNQIDIDNKDFEIRKLALQKEQAEYDKERAESKIEELSGDVSDLQRRLAEAEANQGPSPEELEQIRQDAIMQHQQEMERARVEQQKKAALEASKLQNIRSVTATDVPFEMGEKTAEIFYYLCVIDFIVTQYKPSNLYRNVVFNNQIERIKSKSKISDKQIKDLFQGLANQAKDVDELKLVYQTVKNMYELLRGPVRVYLKLRVRLEDRDSNKAIFPDTSQNEFAVSPLTNPGCGPAISNVTNTDPDIINMIDGKEEHTFSRIYYSMKDSADIFDDSVKDTIDNIIPIEGSTIIMAYGPSGSGKTFNLIGDNFNTDDPDYGIIYQTLGYLTTEYNTKNSDPITEISLTSWQYYMLCGSRKSVKVFDSISVYDDTIVNAINSNQDRHSFTNTLNQWFSNKPFIYKYVLDPDQKGNVGKDVNGMKVFPKINFKEVMEQFGNTIPRGGGFQQGDQGRSGIDFVLNRYADTYKDKFIDYHIDVDDAMKIGINENDYNIWKQMSKQKNDGRITISFRSSKVYNFGITLNQIQSISKGKFDQAKINDNDIRLKFPGTDIKTAKSYLRAEASLIFKLLQRIIEYGTVTYPSFDDLIKRAKKTAKPIVLSPGNYEIAKETFTKFYLALVRSRPTRETPNNKDSSRTHLVINIAIKTKSNKKSNLRFVDLAGNEKADENYFNMRLEGNGITASLLAIKELLKAKQKGKTKVDHKELDNDDMRMFFTSCVTKQQKEFCKTLYKDLLGTFELNTLSENKKLFNLSKMDTTVSMYLNLPTYLKKKGDPGNQCVAIADSLYFIRELQKQTVISKELYRLEEGHCNSQWIKWNNAKNQVYKHNPNKFGDYYQFGNYFGFPQYALSYGEKKRKRSAPKRKRSAPKRKTLKYGSKKVSKTSKTKKTKPKTSKRKTRKTKSRR